MNFSKPKMYEVTFSLKTDPHLWNSILVHESDLLLKIMEVTSNSAVQLECVALLSSNRKTDTKTE